MTFAATPPTITSSPPSPSMVSDAEPPVIVLAAAEPKIVIEVDTALASTFRKFLIVVVPEVS